MSTSSPSLDDLASVLDDLQRTVPSDRSDGGVDERNSPASSSFSHVVHPFSEEIVPTSGESSHHDLYNTAPPPSSLPPSTTSKKYKLWIVPEDTSKLCFKVIGQGSTFCIDTRCTKAHKSSTGISPLPGQIFVLKNNTTAFVTPTIDSKVLGSVVIDKWFSQACTLDEWYQRFLLVKEEIENPILRLPSQKISELDIIARDEVVTNALAYKTPRKKIVKIPDQLSVTVPELARLEEELDQTQNIYSILDKRFSDLVLVLETLHQSQQKDYSSNVEGLESFDLKLEKLKDSIGSRPFHLEESFQAPNVWLTVALIADSISQLQSLDIPARSEVLRLIQDNFDNSSITATISNMLEPLSSDLHKLNKFTVDAVKLLNRKILSSTSNHQMSDHSPYVEDLDSRERRIWEKVNAIDNEIASIRSSSDETAIRFGQLGLRNLQELSAWMEIHNPEEDYGYLVDMHLVFEHVYAQIHGQKLMSNFEKIYKMKLSSNNAALAITSFEARLPRFFSSDNKNYIRKDESYFPAIKSWDDWDLPNDGHRDRLKQELHLFKTGHQFLLDTELTSLTPFHTLCQLALTESVSWVEGICKFLDETYNEYSRSRYGSKRAWHITTRLGKALIEKVAAPRNSVHNSFKISNPFEVSKSITYASLRALDLMMEISGFNFKNSPIVTSELSKFLALNSNFEVVEKLHAKVNALEIENNTLKREVKQAASAASTAANKWDSTFKSIVEDLKKRVRLLENRS